MSGHRNALKLLWHVASVAAYLWTINCLWGHHGDGSHASRCGFDQKHYRACCQLHTQCSRCGRSPLWSGNIEY
jgi:hypothetical protein